MCCGCPAQLCSDFPILSLFWGIFRGPSCPGLQSFIQSVKRSSQGLKPLPFISCGSAVEPGCCAGLIITFLCLSTPKESINIGINMDNVSELVISLFSVSKVAVGVVFCPFQPFICSRVGRGRLWCSLHADQTTGLAQRVFVCLMRGGLFFQISVLGFFRHWNLYFSLMQWADRLNLSYV